MLDWVTPLSQETFADGFMVGQQVARRTGMTNAERDRLLALDIRTAGSWHSGRAFGFLMALAKSGRILVADEGRA